MYRAAFFLSLCCLASFAATAPIAFVLNTNTTIDMVNVANNNNAFYGPSTFQSNSLAKSPTSQLYIADANGNLWDVTGGPIPVGPTGRTQIGDLDWASNGLWGFSNASSELFFFDLGSTSITYSAVISGLGPATVTGVAHESSSGDIYLSANTGLNTDVLYRVPFSATSVITVGSMAIGDAFSYISDIDFDGGGSLVAITFFHRYFYTVNTSNAAMGFVSAGPHKDTTGMALDPVPEPTTLFALGGMLMLFARRRATASPIQEKAPSLKETRRLLVGSRSGDIRGKPPV